MKVGFIGAGRVGCSLGKYLSINGVHINGYYSRSKSSADYGAILTNSKSYTDLDSLIQDSNAIYTTVPDSDIHNVWNTIKQYNLKDKYICHCSGLLTSQVFNDAMELGAIPTSLHMLQAVSTKDSSYTKLKDAIFTIETPVLQDNAIYDIITHCGNTVIPLQADNKIKYHASASIMSNLVTALIYTGSKLLQDCDFSESQSLQIPKDLILGNIENIFNQGVVNSLTGPVERNDINTIVQHLSVLNQDFKQEYISCAKVLITIAERKNPNTDYSKLSQLLDSYT